MQLRDMAVYSIVSAGFRQRAGMMGFSIVNRSVSAFEGLQRVQTCFSSQRSANSPTVGAPAGFAASGSATWSPRL